MRMPGDSNGSGEAVIDGATRRAVVCSPLGIAILPFPAYQPAQRFEPTDGEYLS
jgi:hypothetical protein